MWKLKDEDTAVQKIQPTRGWTAASLLHKLYQLFPATRDGGQILLFFAGGRRMEQLGRRVAECRISLFDKGMRVNAGK